MDKWNDVLRILGRIEGELVGIRKLSSRIAQLEMWLWWMRGGWAALLAASAYMYGQR